MKRIRGILPFSIFMTSVIVCCLGCKKDSDSAETIIEGRVYDIKLNTEIQGVKVFLIREYGPYFFTASKIEYIDSAVTNVNGDYLIKSKLLKNADYAVYAGRPSASYYQPLLSFDFPGKKDITPGQTNVCYFNFIPTVLLSLHITNKSYHNRTNLKVAVDTATIKSYSMLASYFGGRTYYHFIADTVIKTRVPKISTINAIIGLNSGPNGFETNDTTVALKQIQILKNDTTINIVNP